MEHSVVLPIEGMTCAACAGRIERVINRQPNLKASVSYANESAEIIFDPVQYDVAALISLVKRAGYGVRIAEEEWFLQGLEEPSAEKRVRQVLAGFSLLGIEIRLADGALVLSWLEGMLDVAALQLALQRAGFACTPQNSQAQSGWWQYRHLILAVFFTLPFLPGMLAMLWGEMRWMLPVTAQWGLATVVQFWVGARFYRGAWHALKNGAANMDVLVVLGTSVSYGYSIWLWLAEHNPHGYFEASCMIITLVLLGKLLEQQAKRRTREALQGLMGLQPSDAIVWQAEKAAWETCAIAEIVPGQRLLLRAGDSVAVDGVVSSGDGWLDESMLTGESMPVEKSMNAVIFSGTVLQRGLIEYTATAVGQQTRLAGIIQLVKSAQGSKAPVEQLTDQIAAWFVPAIVLIALLTFVITGVWLHDWHAAFTPAVSVLVIACPCALGLATPTVMMVGMGQAARHGMLFKAASALQQVGKMTTLAVDKTGTLTRGVPQLIGLNALQSEMNEHEILQLAASLEQKANHPLAVAIIQAAVDRGVALLDTSEVRQVAGKGVEGSVIWQGEPLSLVLSAVVVDKLSRLARQQVADWQSQGGTVVMLQRLDTAEVLGLLALADQVREGAAVAVSRLRHLDIDVVMLTGDHPVSAVAIARSLAISQVHAGLLPGQKAEIIQQLQSSSAVVGMLGDGINDAPALATADIGMVVMSGSDIAKQTADLALMSADVQTVVRAVELSRAVMRKVKQNLWFAFIYNVIGIPLAIAGLLNPVWAAAAMALSSVSVVGNALLLKRWRPSR